MRVIAGRHRGASLLAPRGHVTRPTPDRVREALFSILDPVEGLRVLDLFAGSGALAIEALSRGAAEATIVDTSSRALDAVRRNLTALGLEAEVRRQDALQFLQRARRRERQYDLVLVDPPYRLAARLGTELGPALAPLLAPAGKVVAESEKRSPLDLQPLLLLDERRYGDTLIRIYGPR